MQLGVFFDARLTEHDATLRVKTDAQPIDHDIERVLLDVVRRRIVGGQHMPIGRKKITSVLLLERDPVLERAVEMAQVKLPSCRSHTADNRIHSLSILSPAYHQSLH